MDQTDYLEHGAVRLGIDGASEMDGSRRLVHVPRADIVGLQVVHGSAAERPLISLILAVLLATLSLVGPMMLVGALLGRGKVEIRFVTTIAFIVPAIWLFSSFAAAGSSGLIRRTDRENSSSAKAAIPSQCSNFCSRQRIGSGISSALLCRGGAAPEDSEGCGEARTPGQMRA